MEQISAGTNEPVTFGSIEGRTFVSRAVIRSIRGDYLERFCAAEGCGEKIVYNSTNPILQVIANEYDNGVWRATYRYHEQCYAKDGYPFGEPFTGDPLLTIEERVAAGIDK